MIDNDAVPQAKEHVKTLEKVLQLNSLMQQLREAGWFSQNRRPRQIQTSAESVGEITEARVTSWLKEFKLQEKAAGQRRRNHTAVARQETTRVESGADNNPAMEKFLKLLSNRKRAEKIRETFAPVQAIVSEVSTGESYLHRSRYVNSMSRHELLMTAVSEEFSLNVKQQIVY